MSNITKTSLLFNNIRRVVGRKSKSTLTYDVDKTFAQKWIASRTAHIKEMQKFHGVC
jgi:hypothetical protein